MTFNVVYEPAEQVWVCYEALIRRLITKENLNKICDVGGGANPVLSLDFILERQLDYTILDISDKELEKAPEQYKKLCKDITEQNLFVPEKFDLVFTKMLAEHVKDGAAFHKNIYSILKNGGMAVHFFPTLYAFPFVVNRLVPEKLASLLLDVFSTRDRYQHAKFPAYYSWCRGPTSKMLRNFSCLGYEIIEYKGLFGHAGYYRKIPLVRWIHERVSEYLVQHPNPYLTSYAYVVLRKP